VSQAEVDALPPLLYKAATEGGLDYAGARGFNAKCSTCFQRDRRDVRATWRVPATTKWGRVAFACDRHMLHAIVKHARPRPAMAIPKGRPR
jgi:hypothetical protein